METKTKNIITAEVGEESMTQQSTTLVPWWSFTKVAISAAALVLVRDGKIGLDDPFDGKLYSLRNLLQHTSGLSDYGMLSEYQHAVECGDAPWVSFRYVEQGKCRQPVV